MSVKLQHPSSMIVAGASMSGKTTFIEKLIKSSKELFSSEFDSIIICYARNQDIYGRLQKHDPKIELCEGLDFCTLPNQQTLVIIDDQMTNAGENKKMQTFFTTDVHHKNVSIIFICHNLFWKSKFGRDLRLSTHYYVLFKSPTFISQVGTLGRQLYPTSTKFLSSAYQKATKDPYTYLFVNLHPNCEDDLRVCSGILPGENFVVYLPE